MRGGQHARRAKAALQRMMLTEGGLQRGQRIVRREALDGDHAASLGLDRQHQAGADCGAVDDDRACPAHAMLATKMSSGLPQLVAQAIGEMHARLDIDRDRLAVKLKPYLHRTLRARAALRRLRSTSVATRARR